MRHWQLDSDALEGAPVEIVTLRVRAAGRVCRFALPRSRAPRARPADRRPVIFPGTGLVECEHLDPMRSGRAR